MKKIVTLFLLIISLCNCGPSITTKNRAPEMIGELHSFNKGMVKGGEFWITTFEKITDKNLPYVFYIEGDGKAFINRYKISDDPTPYPPMLLKLAVMDPRPNVIYIARPCQYTPMELNPTCLESYWTNKRFSEEVVSSVNEVIEKLGNNLPFSLVGFSGGGGIAVLVAARNPKVRNILTLAANLDHVTYNKHHNALPMIGSLNPIDFAPAIKNVPQLHLAGGLDKIVPLFVIDKYVRASDSICVHQHVFPQLTHTKGWDKVWLYALQMPIACYKN